MLLEKYDTLFFDFDGVILDSNKIKIDAFYELALPFGEKNANKLLSELSNLFGKSRFTIMRYFVNDILELYDEELILDMSDQYGKITIDKAMNCDMTNRCLDFLESINHKKKYIVSGTLDSDLKKIVKHKCLDRYFDGIYGSPESKTDIIKSIEHENSVFIGDAISDSVCSMELDMDFIFIKGYTNTNEKDLKKTPIACYDNLYQIVEDN